MLKLHHTHHFELPHLAHSTHRLELSPAIPDHDELIESIETARREDTITLENTPDVEQLDEFWNGVQEDLKKDPEWYDFTED